MDAIIKLYKFNELNDEIKEKLIEEETQEQANFYCETCLHDDMIQQAEALLQETFKTTCENIDVYYDLSYSQGSGSMVQFTINFEDINKKYKILDDEETRFIKEKGIVNCIEIYHHDNYYYHEYTFSIKYDDNLGCYDYEDIKNEYKITEENFNKIEDKIIELLDDYNKHNTKSQFITDIITMNKTLTRYGYNIIENEENFKQGAIDFLNESDYLYFEDGTMFTGDYKEVE